jgi:hypothetical protein
MSLKYYFDFVWCVSTMPCKEGEEAMNARDKRKIRYDIRNMTPSLEKNPVDFKLFGEISGKLFGEISIFYRVLF